MGVVKIMKKIIITALALLLVLTSCAESITGGGGTIIVTNNTKSIPLKITIYSNAQRIESYIYYDRRYEYPEIKGGETKNFDFIKNGTYYIEYFFDLSEIRTEEAVKEFFWPYGLSSNWWGEFIDLFDGETVVKQVP